MGEVELDCHRLNRIRMPAGREGLGEGEGGDLLKTAGVTARTSDEEQIPIPCGVKA